MEVCGHFDLPCLEVRTLRYKRGKIQSSSMCMCVCVCVRVGGWGWKKEWLSNLGNLLQNATHERSERNRSKRQNWVEIIHGISIQTTFITLIKCVKIKKKKLATQTFALDPKATAIFGIGSQRILGNLRSYLKHWLFWRTAAVHICKVIKVYDVAVVPKANGKERNDGH